MANVVTKYAARKMLGKQLDKYQKRDPADDYDPYYAYIEKPRRFGGTKRVKVKKQIPDYLPEHDAVILAKMRQRAYWLDCSLFSLLGVRFGWSSVIGLVPAAGDLIDGLFALMLYWRCTKVTGGLPFTTHLLMLFHIAVDLCIGLVPIIGDVFDAAYKANTKNLRVLEEYLDQKYKPDELRREEKKLKRESRPPPATAVVYPEDDSDLRGSEDRLVQAEPVGNPAGRRDEAEAAAAVPALGRDASATPSPWKEWFSGFKKNRRPEHDVEAQIPSVQEQGVIRE